MKRIISCLLLLLLLAACEPGQVLTSIQGVVLDEAGEPIAGAVVRVKATQNATTTATDGTFSLGNLTAGEPVFITAWASGYTINGVEAVLPGTRDLEISLHAHATADNPAYAFLPATFHPGQGEDQGCARCHSAAGTEISFPLPVDEWLLDAHAQSAVNPRFLSMYLGTDLAGNQSPATRYIQDRDYGRLPVRPDLSLPYYGPGYRLDFPDSAGNCAACHTPLAAVNAPYDTNPSALAGISLEGINCDFCHKVWEADLDPQTGLPYPNMPGVLSFEFRRPPEGHQFFAGPLDDVAPGEDTYSPLQRQSQFCAACHYGVFWGTTVYNSFGEWLESPYSQAETGKTCQDCHMPSSGEALFALPEAGGTQRDPASLFSHRMPGAADETLLQNAISLTASARSEAGQVIVAVSLLNDKSGHHVPTDSPLRQLILLVQAVDEGGEALTFLSGPTVPEWGGAGDPSLGYYAGLPGKGFAKILAERWTGVSPSGAYWNPTTVVSDNRLPAFGVDESEYTFQAPAQGEAVEVTVRLLFRRAFMLLMEQKGWEVADILMEEQVLELP